MWSDDGTDQKFKNCLKKPSSGKTGAKVDFIATFSHTDAVPAKDRWFALLWPDPENPPAEDTDPNALTHTTDVALSSDHTGWVARFALTLPDPDTYELLVGYKGVVDGAGKEVEQGHFGLFGAVTVNP